MLKRIHSFSKAIFVKANTCLGNDLRLCRIHLRPPSATIINISILSLNCYIMYTYRKILLCTIRFKYVLSNQFHRIVRDDSHCILGAFTLFSYIQTLNILCIDINTRKTSDNIKLVTTYQTRNEIA